jgi:hypothetical protein
MVCLAQCGPRWHTTMVFGFAMRKRQGGWDHIERLIRLKIEILP